MIFVNRAIGMTFSFLLLFAGFAMAGGEWNPNSGGDIYNTNTGGKVGIGTANPSVKLHVIGPEATSSTGWKSEIIAGAANNYQSQRVGLGLDASGPRSGIGLMWQGNTLFKVDNIGNVGIGTTSPGAKLDVNGNAVIGATSNSDTSIPLRLKGLAVSDGTNPYGNYAGMLFDANSGYTISARRYLITNALGINKFGIIRSVDAMTDPALGTNGAIISGKADFVIDNTGNVGIGEKSPGARLDVDGNVIIGTTANKDTTIPLRINGLAVSDGASPYGNYGGILFDVNSSYTASARRYLITNALEINKFGIIRSADASKDPTIGTAGAITSGAADFVIDNSGNVGIGTTTPGSKFEIYNRVSNQNRHSLFKINYGNWVARQLDFGIESNSVFIDVTRPGDGSVAELSLNPSGGNVGIGTRNPSSKMHLYDIGALALRIESSGANNAVLDLRNSKQAWNIFSQGATGSLVFDGGISNTMVMDTLGNVGIGTSRPQSKLSVNGTITAKEIKVTSNWADFVFEEDYELASLGEVESFIRENKHLPDIPSAKDVKQQGLAVSEILAKHMQKIEELTLYLINMKKENDQLKATIEIQKEQISELKSLRERIEALEQKN